MTLKNSVLVLGGTLTGLFAGLLYSFSVAIVPALRASKATQHIAVMQALNVKIENPVFFLSFFGPVVLLPWAAFLHRGEPQFAWLVAASVIQIVGANGVTVAGNIPLNNELARVDVEHISESEADSIRTEYQGPGSPWMRLHAVRTPAATAATALVFVVTLSKSDVLKLR
jgi:uncharacterized membrane protein